MATWQEFEKELNIWRKNGEMATLWWRDDDAAALTPQLEKLANISEKHDVPIHLAAIPAHIEQAMIERVLQSNNLWILQHGYAHKNHAPSGVGNWELGDHRPIEDVLDQLQQGFEMLSSAFGARFIPVQVPPWTRISPTVAGQLKTVGFKALSVEGPRSQSQFLPLINIINPHCDPIKWKSGAKFKGAEYVLEVLTKHLFERRAGGGDKSEATGICTHHLDHDEDLWRFLNELADFTMQHQATNWVCLKEELF